MPRIPKPTAEEIQAARIVLNRAGYAVMQTQDRYQCSRCETVLDEGERRCEECHIFGAKMSILGTCPHCGGVLTEEEGLS